MSPRIVGYSLHMLPSHFRKALETYLKNGALQKVGEIEWITIKTRGNDSPVHKSQTNPEDKEDVISVRIQPKDGSRACTHHVYANGTGTMNIGDKREYSTIAERRE
ncbi:Hypothetical protein R9X50_00149100 [Acrodontium crateriforme]|uniref:Uncharacterized protein n=1 Tax=Acrodontium crateriforme TaxID=150365 RepID=A0AAQ3LZU2_9PEZI|nr:Hypothetical protein R9X50_00149100 [Acrodontium crateriforme]